MMYMHDPDTTEAKRIQNILDAKYCKAELAKIAQECDQLDKEDQQKLLKLLQKYEHLFDGTVGTWNTNQWTLSLRILTVHHIMQSHTLYHTLKRKSSEMQSIGSVSKAY